MKLLRSEQPPVSAASAPTAIVTPANDLINISLLGDETVPMEVEKNVGPPLETVTEAVPEERPVGLIVTEDKGEC